MLGLFVFSADRREIVVFQSKPRITAESQFLKTQTKSLSRSRIISDEESLAQQRTENTARLKELRLAKEAQDREATLASEAVKRSRRKPKAL